MNPTFVNYWSAEGCLGCLCFLTTWIEWQCTRQSKYLWSRMCGSLAICPRMVELGAMVFILLFEFSTRISRRPYWFAIWPTLNEWGFPFPHIFSSICCHFVWPLYSWKRFSPSVASSLTRLVVSLAVKKPFGFMRTHLSFLALILEHVRSYSKRPFLYLYHVDHHLVIILALPVFQVQVLVHPS